MATGWGNKTWGASDWGDLSNETVLVSSVALSTSIGSSTTEANANVEVSGITASYILQGAVAGASADVVVSGISLSAAIGNDSATPIGQNVSVTGIVSTTGITAATIDTLGLIGSGWGRDLWGSMVWGDAYSVQTGSVSAQTAIGAVSTQIDVSVLAQGIVLSTAIGDEIPQADAIVTPSGIALIGSIVENEALTIVESNVVVDLNTPVDVTGSSLAIAIGDEEAFTDVTVAVTGISATYAFGDVIIESKYSVDGIPLSAAINSVTIDASAVVTPTGIGLTITAANPNIIAWAEVDVGTEVTWTPVDLAA